MQTLIHLLSIYHVSFPGLGIHDLEISRIAFTLRLFGRSFPIYWYGIGYALGFGLCLWLAMRHAPRYELRPDDLLDSYLLLILLGLAGGRLYYVLFSLDKYRGHWLDIFKFRDGGMGFYGGVIGGILALLITAKAKHLKASTLLDYFAVYLPLGQAIGRWGNFFNQEAFGANTTLPWGMISEGTRDYLRWLGPPHRPDLPVHPTFFYEFLGNLILFGVLLALRPKLFRKRPYTLVATYFIGYGILRYLVEGLRTDSLYIGQTGIRVSQALSLVLLIGSVAFILYQRRKDPLPLAIEAEPTPTPVEESDDASL